MPVNSLHTDYLASLPDWLRARDVLAGENAIKAGGERYLPRLDSQSDEEFMAYRRRASFFNATARTAEGFVGLIFRRPPFVKVPESQSGVGRALAGFLNDADMLGTTLAGYAKDVVTEVVGIGRAGSLVDWDGDVENRAYVSLYSAEQILNWRVERVNGRNLPTMVVLKETATKAQQVQSRPSPRPSPQTKLVLPIGRGRRRPSDAVGMGMANPDYRPGSVGDPFEAELVDQIRVLRLMAHKEDGSYEPVTPGGHQHRRLGCVVEIWQAVPDGSFLRRRSQSRQRWDLIETRIPTRRGKPLPLIPFVFHGPRHSRPAVDKVPLQDIIAVNLDHYRLDADYKHGLHFTALPTAWVSGFDKSATLRIGSSTAWVSETPGATAGFLEFSGQGLTTFERAMDRDERLMAVLGSRLLHDEKRVAETAEAIRLRQSGEDSALSSIATSVGESLTQVLRWVYWWNSTEVLPNGLTKAEVLLKLNNDFGIAGMSSQELQAIVAAWQSGAISRDTMFELFRRGEILPDGRTNQDEAALVAQGKAAQ